MPLFYTCYPCNHVTHVLHHRDGEFFFIFTKKQIHIYMCVKFWVTWVTSKQTASLSQKKRYPNVTQKIKWVTNLGGERMPLLDYTTKIGAY